MLGHDPAVRRGKVLVRATLSPVGVGVAAVLAGIGLAAGIGVPWVVAAAVAAWGTSVVLHLRDSRLVSALLAPQLDRDLGELRGEHRRLMLAGLAARDRFEREAASFPDELAGMGVRITAALERLYDSLRWAQRAGDFLDSVDETGLRRRLSQVPRGSPVAAELAAQLTEIGEISRRREEALARSAATVTGIETLVVKVGSLALGVSAPGEQEGVGELRDELDRYLAGLDEIQESLRILPPQPS